MRIAQISPLMESVPPRFYGGTERVVSWLTEELVALGHDVTLFASGDSITNATLVGCCKSALRLDPTVRDANPHLMLMLDMVRNRADEFDVIHFHMDILHFPLFRPLAERTLTTLHGRQDLPDLEPLYRGFQQMPMVSISESQASFIPYANIIGTVPHGLPANLLRPNYNPRGGYLAFLGRISPEKRPDIAIAIARALGVPLKIAAKVDKVDKTYFHEEIEPLLDGPCVEYIGEINEQEKQEFLGQALALMFPIDWPEPFGLAMIEAMACGTPTLAFRKGSVAEVINDGVSGRVVGSLEEAVAAFPSLMALDRRVVRRTFEERFSATRMAKDYVALYHQLLNKADALDKVNGTRLVPVMGDREEYRDELRA